MTVKKIPADDWTDQDLLTRSEASERLLEAMAESEAELAEVEAAPSPDASRVIGLQKRLADLREALSSQRGGASAEV